MPAPVWDGSVQYKTDTPSPNTYVQLITSVPQVMTLPFFWQSSVSGSLGSFIGAQQMLEIDGITVDMTTTATVGNRRLVVQLYLGGGLAWEFRVPTVQAASVVRHYEFVAGGVTAAIGTTYSIDNIGTTPLRLFNGTNLAFLPAAVIDAADTISVCIRGTVRF